MPLETATYISQLVSTNPAHTDGLSDADAHMRLIKAVLKAQFPNWTAAVLTSTQAQIDAVITTVGTTGVSVLADAGAFFKTNNTAGLTNPSATEVDVKVANIVVAKFFSTGSADGSITIPGNLTVAGALTATVPGLIPVGGSLQWWTDTLPSMPGVTYGWLNGQAVSRTTYAALFALLGTTYGAGDGTTTFNLPDTRDNVLVGSGDMGATAAVNRITNFVSTTLGNLFGTCLHLLTTGEMPAHSHTATSTVTDPGHTHSVPSGASSTGPYDVNGAGQRYANPQTTGSSTTGVTVATSNANTGGGASHNNVQPSIVCNHVMRIA